MLDGRRGPRWSGGFVRRDGIGLAHCEADVVETVEQAIGGEVIERERCFETDLGGRQGAALHVDGDLTCTD